MPPANQPPRKLSRADLLILVKKHLERAASTGLTKAELLAAIGPTRTSAGTIQRVLDDLRSDTYEAQLTCHGKIRRWVLEARLAIPLEAPDQDDLLAVLLAQAILAPLLDAALAERLDKIVEDLDARVRSHSAATDLPTRKAMTSSLSLGTKIDPRIFRSLLAACRRKTIRIRYASPWRPPVESAAWHEIEPWALHVHDGAPYLRAWSTALQGPRTYRVAHIDECEEQCDPTTSGEPVGAAPRQKIPADPWGAESPAYGIDHDRPGTAVVRFRGDIARWVKTTTWHPTQEDKWIVVNELLERTLPYRSCRETARRLASVGDGLDSIEPAELKAEVVALGVHLASL